MNALPSESIQPPDNALPDILFLKADLLKALGHPVRLALVEMLGEGERCVCELNQRFPTERSAISKHLAILKAAGVVSDRKAGLRVYYKLDLPCILGFLGCLSQAITERTQKQVNALGYQMSPAPTPCCERSGK